MPSFVMPNQVTALPAEQQEAIRQVLIKNNLLTSSGELEKLTAANMPEKHKAALAAMGVENASFLGIPNAGCIAARIGEAAAIAACALVPGGQIAIAACIAVAHEAANLACK